MTDDAAKIGIIRAATRTVITAGCHKIGAKSKQRPPSPSRRCHRLTRASIVHLLPSSSSLVTCVMDVVDMDLEDGELDSSPPLVWSSDSSTPGGHNSSGESQSATRRCQAETAFPYPIRFSFPQVTASSLVSRTSTCVLLTLMFQLFLLKFATSRKH